jgi:ribulose-phosphate 3-epimerase
MTMADERRPRRVRLAPSILSADFARLGEQLHELEEAGVERVQIDVMDGCFVPPITMGPLIVEAVRRACRLPIEAHLMVERPERHINEFIAAGAEIVIVHQEATVHLHRLVHAIKESGARAGVALNPATPAAALDVILNDLDLVLVMTVDPGYAGQAFIEGMLPKIERVRGMIEERGIDCELEVDGGIGPETAPLAVAAGADVLVAASAIFQHPEGIAAGVRRLRESIPT